MHYCKQEEVLKNQVKEPVLRFWGQKYQSEDGEVGLIGAEQKINTEHQENLQQPSGAGRTHLLAAFCSFGLLQKQDRFCHP